MEKSKKRALRRSHADRVLHNRLKLSRELFTGRYAIEWNKPSRFRDRHPLDCGKTRCMLCHGEKLLFKKARRREFRKEL